MNLDIYTEEMRKSIWDKAFFMDKIPGVDCTIDFGCADASMICFLAKLFPRHDFLGYDISADMTRKALKNASSYFNVWIMQDLGEITTWVKLHTTAHGDNNISINFSSVLHEVFSKGSTDIHHVDLLINAVKPKYITIRDMYWNDKPQLVDRDESNRIYDMLDNDFFTKYVAHRGAIITQDQFVNLLLHHEWKNNGAEEEIKENYFSWKIDDIESIASDYIVVYENHYQLPFIAEKWKQEYNFWHPEITTHAQFILRRVD